MAGRSSLGLQPCASGGVRKAVRLQVPVSHTLLLVAAGSARLAPLRCLFLALYEHSGPWQLSQTMFARRASRLAATDLLGPKPASWGRTGEGARHIWSFEKYTDGGTRCDDTQDGIQGSECDAGLAQGCEMMRRTLLGTIVGRHVEVQTSVPSTFARVTIPKWCREAD